MKKFLIPFFFIFALSSCNKKSLDLPQVAVAGISEIQNYSQIWVFYKHDTDKIKAEINKNNTISTTHWIINIDKRLPLSEVIPVFNMVKAKRAKKSIHSSEGAKDYLSYSNVLESKISLFSIDSIQYIMLPKQDINQLLSDKPCKNTIEFSKEKIVVNQKEIQKSTWNKKQLESLSAGCVQLVFDKEISYQDYMEYRLKLISLLPDDISIETTEFIF